MKQEVNFINVFTTEIWRTNTSEIDNIKLSKIILEQEETVPPVGKRYKKSSYGGWQSYEELKDDKRFFDLWHFIDQSFYAMAPHYNYKTAVFPKITSAWANVNRQKNFNLSHTHPGAQWSGCYYLKAPLSCGTLCFKDPRSARQMVQHPPSLFTTLVDNYSEAEHYGVVPNEGLLVLFPSWLEHFVFPNESDEPRISISFNMVVSI